MPQVKNESHNHAEWDADQREQPHLWEPDQEHNNDANGNTAPITHLTGILAICGPSSQSITEFSSKKKARSPDCYETLGPARNKCEDALAGAGAFFMGFMQGEGRTQGALFPVTLEEL
ncbi:MAG TPA: hypothetical protein VN810_13270, partial [Terriglobales bacterium]|nr:hypothetical protein [Terriglobales bacterium]